MTDALIHGDTLSSATMRHEVPLAIMDPFLFMEAAGRSIVLTNLLERDRIARVLPHAELLVPDELGMDELIERGLREDDLWNELAGRAVERAGVTRALVPSDFPIGLADHLRDSGVELVVDAAHFRARRRAKHPLELEGIRRAQRAAEAGLAAAAAQLRDAQVVGDRLELAGEVLTADALRDVIRATTAAHGAPSPPDIMVTTAWSGGGHDPGTGPLPANLPITIDLWPRDEETGCWADMTRTFVVGDVPDAVCDAEVVVREALELARADVRPGITGKELYDIAAQRFEDAGYDTRRTAAPGEELTTGFYFSLGHGIGLEVHEAPGVGRTGDEPLVVGDVIALEPGLEGMPFGGVRYEDLVLVTDDGFETLTDFPYDLDPVVSVSPAP